MLPLCFPAPPFPAPAVAALLATVEVGTVLLLHPPGHGSLPLAVFTVMANAPEALVAMLRQFAAQLDTLRTSADALGALKF